MSVLAEALASMSPEARAVLADEIERVVQALRTPPTTPARRPRAKHVPRVAMPADVTPDELRRAEAELARRGVG